MKKNGEDSELDDMVKVIKSDLKVSINIKMLQRHPDYSNRITRRMLIDAHNFIDGFGSCLKEFINPPYNKEEIQKFMLEEAFNFVLSRIELENQ